MSKNIECAWFKTPKELLKDQEFRALFPTSKVLLWYLLMLFNTFKRKPFVQSFDKLTNFTGLSQKQIRSAKEELIDFGITIKRKGNYWEYDLNKFYTKYIKIKTLDDGMT